MICLLFSGYWIAFLFTEISYELLLKHQNMVGKLEEKNQIMHQISFALVFLTKLQDTLERKIRLHLDCIECLSNTCFWCIPIWFPTLLTKIRISWINTSYKVSVTVHFIFRWNYIKSRKTKKRNFISFGGIWVILVQGSRIFVREKFSCLYFIFPYGTLFDE